MTPDQHERWIAALQDAVWPFLAHDPFKPELFWNEMLRGLAPLIAEARREGAEQGWDECHRASLGGFDAHNPYRVDETNQER